MGAFVRLATPPPCSPEGSSQGFVEGSPAGDDMGCRQAPLRALEAASRGVGDASEDIYEGGVKASRQRRPIGRILEKTVYCGADSMASTSSVSIAASSTQLIADLVGAGSSMLQATRLCR